MTQFKHRKNKQSGAVLTELTFVTPILFFLISGVVTLGQGLSQVAWMSETAYQSALVGAEMSTETEAINSMASRVSNLTTTNKTMSRGARTVSVQVVNPTQNISNETVGIIIQAHVDTILGSSNFIPLSIEVHGPILANLNQNTGNLGTFQNPDDLRNCSGNLSVDGAQTPCWSCASDTGICTAS